jgi:membrane-associated protease RseP (regulator of RpoE activity)
MARRHGVEVALPYFVPFPMGLGTLGAFVQMKSLIKTRRAIFDIGIAGPLAGLVVALPLLYFGVRTENAPSADGNRFAVDARSSMFLALLQQSAPASLPLPTTIRPPCLTRGSTPKSPGRATALSYDEPLTVRPERP